MQYFSTWAGFIITIFLLVECYQGVAEAQSIHGNGVEQNGAKHDTNGGGIAVEAIEEEEDYI